MLGGDHPDVALLLNNMASLLERQVMAEMHSPKQYLDEDAEVVIAIGVFSQRHHLDIRW